MAVAGPALPPRPPVPRPPLSGPPAPRPSLSRPPASPPSGPLPAPTLPGWSWAYVTFRFGDGASHALISLAIVVHYGLPLWALAATTAAMNLAGVPGTFLWSKAMDRAADRRRLAVAGFGVAAAAMAALAFLPAFPVFAAAAILFTFFGVATSPAASTMVLQGVPRESWSVATGRLSRRTGLAFLSGMVASIFLAQPAVELGDRLFHGVFAAAAVAAAGAALLAARTLPSAASPASPAARPEEAAADVGVVQQSQRVFERAVFFPARFLGKLGNWRDLKAGLSASHRLWPIGYALTFTGSVTFFASYPGVLANELGLVAGLVLLCQAPSHMVTPVTYPWAGRRGARTGQSKGVVEGAMIRLLALPLLCVLVVAAGAELVPTRWTIPIVLLLHGLMGLSFSLIQINGPVLLAQDHPRGRGHGVGTYHAAVGTGTLLGSLSAFLLLRAFEHYWASYVFAIVVGSLGCVTLFAAHARSRSPVPAS